MDNLRNYCKALIEGDLPEVENWAARVGVDVRFSKGVLNFVCHSSLRFHSKELTAVEKGFSISICCKFTWKQNTVK